MTRVVIFGATGLLGGSLCPHFAQQGLKVVKAGRSQSSDYVLDISDPTAIEKLLKATTPDYVINLVAATDVDRCESDVTYAYTANTKVPGAIASATKNCRELDIHTVHISTDQVYEGRGPHIEDCINPINVYGLSKYAGELLAASTQTAILRTNFYGKSKVSSRYSFSDWVVASLNAHQSITLFEDVRFSALNLTSLCDIIFQVMRRRIFGTFNVGCRNGISKAEFALALAKKLDLPIGTAKIGRLADLPLKAKRPIDMTLDVLKLETALGTPCPDIFDQIILTAQEYLNA